MSRDYVPESSIVKQEEIIQRTDLVDTIQHLNSNFVNVIKEMINYLNTVDNRAGTGVIARTINNIELNTDTLILRGHITGNVTHNEVQGECVLKVPIEKPGDK